MSERFQIIDRRDTPMGEISLRRRLEPTLHIDVFEVKLGDEFLMSSLFTVAEIALADLALADLTSDRDQPDGDQPDRDQPDRDQPDLDVVVGGLGLGYTARAVLANPRVRTLEVIDALDAVIDWHHQGLVPNADELVADPRGMLVPGDFFQRIRDGAPLGPSTLQRYHAILVDIDHTPSHHLDPTHASFYTEAGLSTVTTRLHPGGVFGLWSDDPPDDEFLATLGAVFERCTATTVGFPNHYTGQESSNTVYLASTAA